MRETTLGDPGPVGPPEKRATQDHVLSQGMDQRMSPTARIPSQNTFGPSPCSRSRPNARWHLLAITLSHMSGRRFQVRPRAEGGPV